MKKSTRHIALLMLVFIAYPFVFQAVHIISHDHYLHIDGSDTGRGHVHFCPAHHNKCEESFRKDNPDEPSFAGQQFLSSIGLSDHEGNHCPLCEHEFAKFSLEKLFNISFADERISLVNNFFYRNPSVLFTGNHRSLRAPPPASLIS
jgi:hypothetical protein